MFGVFVQLVSFVLRLLLISRLASRVKSRDGEAIALHGGDTAMSISATMAIHHQ